MIVVRGLGSSEKVEKGGRDVGGKFLLLQIQRRGRGVGDPVGSSADRGHGQFRTGGLDPLDEDGVQTGAAAGRAVGDGVFLSQRLDQSADERPFGRRGIREGEIFNFVADLELVEPVDEISVLELTKPLKFPDNSGHRGFFALPHGRPIADTRDVGLRRKNPQVGNFLGIFLDFRKA